MATIPPPPTKRQKREAFSPLPIPAIMQRIQFLNADTHEPQGPVVSISLSDLHPRNLSLLLNTLLENSTQTDWRFYNPLHTDEEFSQSKLLTALRDGTASSERTLEIPYRPEAVYRVKAVTRCAGAITGHGAAILTAQFSAGSSSLLATGGGDHDVRVWDCETLTPRLRLRGHTGWVLVVAWKGDGTLLASGGMDCLVRLWDPVKGKAMGEPLKGHTKWITSLAWEPGHKGGGRVASASKDCTVRVWDTAAGRVEFVLGGHKGCVSCVKWGGRGWIYTASQDRTLKVWDADNGGLVYSLEAHAHWINHLALSTDYVLRTGFYGDDAPPETGEGRRDKALQRFNAALKTAGGVERVVTASDDCTMFLWSPSESKKPIQRMTGHQKQVNHVTFSPDGSMIASCGFDNHTKLWRATDGKFICTLRGHVGPVYQCAFSADSRLLVTASKDTTLKAWNTRTGMLVEDLPGHKDEVYAVDWAPDGERVASGGKDKAVRIWCH
ncbi:prolyl oligopeptidase [Piedraia hortae CBS 480.64]|uniref:Prolyl oligopeptidase n=1 Tax=Piedraia hortae CBS 480.64 TaxID=1314780 RepID=A0A6A7BR93_9PEZI|nr:prolyl oligopeptidase [Piedraia hortae CBS 480.64]